MEKYKYWHSKKDGDILVSKMNSTHIVNTVKYLRRMVKANYYETLEEIREVNGWINEFKRVLKERYGCYRDKSLNLFTNQDIDKL